MGWMFSDYQHWGEAPLKAASRRSPMATPHWEKMFQKPLHVNSTKPYMDMNFQTTLGGNIGLFEPCYAFLTSKYPFHERYNAEEASK